MAEVLDIEKTYLRSVKELKVYQKAYQTSLDIHAVSLAFPKIEQYALADQLRRSTKSICANLAEGYARQQQSKAEFKRFIALAVGSCNEVLVWLDYAQDLGYIDGLAYEGLCKNYESILQMLLGLRNAVKE